MVRLKDRLAEAEEGRRDTHAKLAAARADAHRLEDRVTRLEQDLDQSHSCATCPQPKSPFARPSQLACLLVGPDRHHGHTHGIAACDVHGMPPGLCLMAVSL